MVDEIDEVYVEKKASLLRQNPNARILFQTSKTFWRKADDNVYYYIAGEFFRANLPIKEQVKKVR